MGGIVSSIFSWFSTKKDAKILILGLDGAGKTTILYQLSLGKFIHQLAPTVAFNIEQVEVGNLTLHVWDLGGQLQLRPYWRLYYKNNNGIVFVVDSSDKERMDVCKKELDTLLSEEELKGVPIVILANKKDLPEHLEAEEISEKLELSKIKDRSWTIFSVSAFDDTEIKTAFQWLSETIDKQV